MSQTIDPSIDQIYGVGVIEDVRVDLKAMPVALVDNRPIKIWCEPWRSPISVVDPDLDEVHFFRGEFEHGLSCLIFGRHFVCNARICCGAGSSVGCSDAPAGDAQARATELCCFLIGSNLLCNFRFFHALSL